MSCPLNTINSYFSFLGAMYFSTSLSSVPSERTVKEERKLKLYINSLEKTGEEKKITVM